MEQRLLCFLLLQLGIWVLYTQGAGRHTRVQYVGLRQKRDFYRTGLRCRHTVGRKLANVVHGAVHSSYHVVYSFTVRL
jgi:hypothetical protein